MSDTKKSILRNIVTAGKEETAVPELYKALTEYGKSGAYPFHMPGHKRRPAAGLPGEFPDPYSIDITEIVGFDNLHHPEGILKESMEWAAGIYGADRTYYLVNGSTCGVLSAICAAIDSAAAGSAAMDSVAIGSAAAGSAAIYSAAAGSAAEAPEGRMAAKLMMARNSHKSAYHAVFLEGVRVRYLYPQIVEEMGLQGGILPQEADEALKADSDIAAVFVTSPTYDGVVSDIRGLADVCHGHGVPLIVDEAHGAHFAFGDGFPVSALKLGADVVIQSLHKTLPSFTQTAVLHMRGSLVDTERLEHYLQIFQSSSPSYVLLAGIERCLSYMDGPGREKMREFEARIKVLRAELSKMKRLRLLSRDMALRGGAFDLDGSRIVVSARGTGVSGVYLAGLLRERYGLEMEMWGADYVTALTSLMDTEEGLRKLENALLEIDRSLDAAAGAVADGRVPAACRGADPSRNTGACRVPAPDVVMTIREARRCRRRQMELEAAQGQISAEYVYLYPPGIPIVAPGEALTSEIIRLICRNRDDGLPVQGLKDCRIQHIEVVDRNGTQ